MAQDNDVLRSTEVGQRTFFLLSACWNRPSTSFSVSHPPRRTTHSTPRRLSSLRPRWMADLSMLWLQGKPA